ncbi:hypothetical protein L6164_004252 [Bauhinia variegata]|uniref:Uncharacterized protein n=1 Tax=Bauhinia variegata TaxID=167791 RepID=A0ACB9Q3U9_BAUVA|nr:hypothetical protein L6164_004252 [Bauhinia variegata]
MEEEEEEMSTPFWLQSDHRGRHLRRSYSLFLSSGALLVFLLVTAAVFIFIIVPTLVSFTSHIFKPHLVKKSWDSLNLVLVLFAIICGFLSRNSNESPRSYQDENFSNAPRDYVKSNPETPRRWYESPDRTSNRSFNRLRSINSYPDLRPESSWVTGDERWRFYDDTNVSGHRGLDLYEHRQLHHGQLRSEADEEPMAIKNTAVDTFVARSEEVPSSPPKQTPFPAQLPTSPLPTQPTEAVRRKTKRTYQVTGQALKIEKQENNDSEVEIFRPAPSKTPPPPPTQHTKAVRRTKRTHQAIGQAEKSEQQENNDLEVENFRRPHSKPPPPLPPVFLLVQESSGENEKMRGSATKDFLTTLRRRKKKQRQKSVESLETILNSEVTHLSSEPSSSTPPPPPPPPSVFHNLFSSKKGKQKKSHPAPPSAPPPRISSMRVSKTKPHIGGVTSHKPNKREIFKLEEEVITGKESPLIPLPPPPPPPPSFKMPLWKFRVQGDYVRVDSISSSRSSSPDLDEVGDLSSNQTSPLNSPSAPNGAESTMPLFCPSPDVDTKADTFIARFRAGLKLEKMNSMTEKQGIRKSNLGPSPIPSPETKEETALPT